jgi:hypothetical protein
MSAFATALLLSAFALLTEAAVPADEVLSLPGWKGKLPTRQYSGYVEIDEKTGKSLHYWFVESETDPATAPVVLWLNGGPGCSSLEGYLAEQGPLHISDKQVSACTVANVLKRLFICPQSILGSASSASHGHVFACVCALMTQ